MSIDFKGNPNSSIVDAPYTKVMDGDFVKVLSWYDNEWGYSNRCVDLLRLLVKKGLVIEELRVQDWLESPMPKLSIRDLDLRGKRVFIRVDFNVPIKNGVISDDTRIRASLPTITYALEQGATVILASHLGRPKGKPNTEFSLRPVADRLSELVGKPVAFADDCIGEPARAAVAQAQTSGAVVLLENLRFHPEEEKNDPAFAKALASLADAYVDDAFGAAHRAHASVEGITGFLPKPAAGLLMEQEIRYLGHALESPQRPFVAILGGAKVSDKLEVIQNLLGKVDRLLIGGAMAYTFFKSRGLPVGRSLVEQEKLEAAQRIEAAAGQRGMRLELPVDHVVTDRIEAGAANEVLEIGDARIGDRIGVDIVVIIKTR